MRAGSVNLTVDPVLLNDWHPVASSRDVKEGKLLKTRLMNEDLVVWRNGNNLMAWQDLCIHRGAKLSMGRIENGRVICPYHGWEYDQTGACVKIPAHPAQTPPLKARVKRFNAKEQYGLIWVCLGNPEKDIPPFPEWNDPSFRKIFCGPYMYNASGPRAIENFLDVAHFPYVHEGLLGDREHAEIQDYEVEKTPEGLVAKDIKVWQPNPDGTSKGVFVSYTYKVFRPLTAYFTKQHGYNKFSIFMTVTPVEQTRSIAWMWIAMNYGFEFSEEEVRSFQDRIVSQDVPVVESQRPELLPLDLQAELHLRSDRTAIAYRKWLKELGLTFGTQ